jgi:hypothetical protein
LLVGAQARVCGAHFFCVRARDVDDALDGVLTPNRTNRNTGQS